MGENSERGGSNSDPQSTSDGVRFGTSDGRLSTRTTTTYEGAVCAGTIGLSPAVLAQAGAVLQAVGGLPLLEGESNWLEGAMLIAVYLVLGVAFFYV